MSAEAQLETPMRWLADKTVPNPRPELWVMVAVGFTEDYNNAPLCQDR